MKMIVTFICLLFLCRMSPADTIYSFTDTLNNDHIQFTLPSFATSGVITSFDVATTSNVFPGGSMGFPPPGEPGIILDFGFNLNVGAGCSSLHFGGGGVPGMICAEVDYIYPTIPSPGVIAGFGFGLQPTSMPNVFRDATGSGAVLSFSPEPNTFGLLLIPLALLGIAAVAKRASAKKRATRLSAPC